MTSITAAELARARKSWDVILSTESPTAQMHASAYWASLWAERLLIAAEGQSKPSNIAALDPRPIRLMTTGEDDLGKGGRT